MPRLIWILLDIMFRGCKISPLRVLELSQTSSANWEFVGAPGVYSGLLQTYQNREDSVEEHRQQKAAQLREFYTED
jgi:hypothetical protein